MLTELISAQSILLTPNNRVVQSPVVTIPALTSQLRVRLQRPTSALPINWADDAVVKISLVLMVNGQEYRCDGQTTGGIRPGPGGQDASFYELSYRPTVLIGDKARTYMETASKDARGFYTNVPLSRIGETGAMVQAYLRVERLSGHIETNIMLAEVEDDPAPLLARYKNSVAFDARTTGTELNGDGVITVSHAGGSGSERAAFVGVHNSHTTPKAGSCTYAGSAMTELWDTQSAFTIVQNAGYILAAITAGTQDAVSTLTGVTWDHAVGVLTFTGVHQTTPNGNQQTNDINTTTSSSVTCTGVGADDYVVDNIGIDGSTLVVGANQNDSTQGWNLNLTFNGTQSGGSSQDGVDGGAMSWSWTGNQSGYHGAVVIEVSAGGAVQADVDRPSYRGLARGYARGLG